MKKSLFRLVCTIACAVGALNSTAQLYVPSGVVSASQNGNVGIGTSNPQSLLQVGGPGTAVTITTPWLFSMKHYESSWGANANRPFLVRGWDVEQGNYLYLGSTGNISNTSEPTIVFSDLQGVKLGLGSNGGSGLNSEWFRISTNGNVGIGTTNPTQKLSVNGTVRAKEVIVETTGWSDYVLADDYVLRPLSEVEKHIKENKHLPGIPSAQHVAEGGIELGEMQAKLLAKIEELTLHLIEQEKRISALEEENRTLKPH